MKALILALALVTLAGCSVNVVVAPGASLQVMKDSNQNVGSFED